ncbi:diadenylate cyclase CdaA [Peptoclostridium litorale]|nr:diadenylate cyclase CdaA [Peptoclostridium litorale]
MNIGILDIIDIAIVAYVFYKLYMLIKETRAEQLVKGILVLVIATKLSELFQLHVVSWILKNTMTVGVIALLIVFQPELRRALEYIGRTKLIAKSPGGFESEEDRAMAIGEISEAAFSLARQKIGALIVVERETGINEIIQTGTQIDARITRQLLINIFIPNTPLHDGAVAIKNNRIMAAGCFLPLTENKYLNKELGTRHRAGIGITEMSDCISIIVSEESGHVSVASNGKLYRNVTVNYLREVLQKALMNENETKSIFKRKEGKKEGFFRKGRFFK